MFLYLTFVSAMAIGAQAEAELPIFVGRAVCLQCHSPERDASVCLVPLIPKHLDAFDSLTKPEALEISTICGDPQEPTRSVICLSCHAAAAEVYPRWTADSFDITDGVQCEACHGASKQHVDTYQSRSADGDADANTNEHADGNDDEHEEEHIPSLFEPPGYWMCGGCHRKLSSHQIVLEQGYRSDPENRLYKTPVNLATSRDGTHLYVVCENSNTLIILDTATGRTVREIAVGKRPHDVTPSPDGSRLYVTNRLSDTLSIIELAGIELAGRATVKEYPVGDEPHGLLTDATGRRLFVLNTGEDTVSVIDTRDMTEVRRLTTGGGPWSLALSPGGQSTDSQSADSQSPKNRSLYVTSVRPQLSFFREPHESEITTVEAIHGKVTGRLAAPETNMLKGIAFVPAGPHKGVALFVMMRSKNLVPATRLAQGWVITNGLGVIWPDGRVDQVLLDQPYASFPDPNDVAVSPDGRYAIVTSGGSDEVAVVDVSRLLETITKASPLDRAEVLPNHMGISAPPDGFVLKRVGTGSNPRGVTFSPDGKRVYVANALDDTVTVIDTDGFRVRGLFDLGGPDVVTEIRRGHKLFHTADATFGRQFSCQSCHPDGHINGLTIDIEPDGIGMKPVDNRTLRGILDTAPFKWEGTNPTLSRQCGPRLAVFFTRLAPFTPDELLALVRYICTIERPPNRYRPDDGLTRAQYRGKLVFERRIDNYGQPIPVEMRCIECHDLAYKTAQIKTAVRTTMWYDAPVNFPVDPNEVYDVDTYSDMAIYFFADAGVLSVPLDVPHLNNIYNSAPYMHNGSAHTLEEIWTRFNILSGHGLTHDMTRRQFNDLIAYLKAL